MVGSLRRARDFLMNASIVTALFLKVDSFSRMTTLAIGEYRVIAELGRGGMAEVFLAVRRGPVGFTKLVVIKRLRTDRAQLPEATHLRALLLDEARLAARLHHPHIVQTFEVSEQDGEPFIAMEYLDGQSLGRVASAAARANVPLPTEMVLTIIADVLSALEYAHELRDFDGTPFGIVHRDVSPQNIFWTYEGEIKLVDFGVAKSTHAANETEVGVVKGKVAYMAPEQARGESIDARADVFAVGIVLWELLSGRRLMRGDSAAASLHRVLFEPIPSLASVRPDLDREIVRIATRALERDRDARYPSAAEMRADITRLLERMRAPRRDDLARFVQRLFAQERAEVSDTIRVAMARDSAEIVVLPNAPVSLRDVDRVETIASSPLALPTPSVTAPPAPRAKTRAPIYVAILATLGAAAAATAFLHAHRAPVAASSASRAPSVAREPDLKLCGSNTVGAELAPSLVEAFFKKKGASATRRAPGESEETLVTATLGGNEITVDVVARGTATGFEGLAASKCDIAMASRPINEKEIAKLTPMYGDLRSAATEHVIALDGIAVIVHPNNPISAIDRASLRDVFTGKTTSWSSLGGSGNITVLARDKKSGTFDTFKNLVLGDADVPSSTRRFESSDELADAVASDPSAIGFIGLAYVRSAKAVAVGDRGTPSMLPTSFTVTTEDYVLSRRLFFYTPPKPRTPLVTELVSFVLSPQGQNVVRDAGFVDLSLAAHDGDACDARCPPAYASLVAHAQRLSLDFRFRTGTSDLDSRAARDLDRVVQFLRERPSAPMMLFGFSDSSGDPASNARLSRERAQTVARELATRGVHPSVVEGFGSAMPVAPNATESDRERNRRVEVWIGR